MKIVIAGGGTAGHVFPAIALAQQLVSRGHELLFVGTDRGLEVDLVPRAGFTVRALHVEPFPRKLSTRLVTAPLSLLRSIGESRTLVGDAQVVVGMGGYASAPAVLAARKAHLPIVLHEQNAVPGAANRFLARWARAVAVSFEESASRFEAHTVHTGNPVRSQVAAVSSARDELRREGLDALGLEPDRRTLIVFGGSQGAAHINGVALEMCRILGDRSDIQVVLLTGEAHIDAVRRQLPQGDLMVQALGFLDRMELAYAVADLAVARAGATSIAELTMCGIPSLLIPYPHATANHQEANARALERVGGAEVILDPQLSPEVLAVHVQRLFGEPGVLAEMARSSGAFGKPEAARGLADLVEGVA